ncbi:MAG: efflux RND transporter periplasmic adaptor subunit [Phycisphaerae bacterium]|nr:efflux RND transporter periplasmic adaptor subunit [Phycisphaerae bacterium]
MLKRLSFTIGLLFAGLLAMGLAEAGPGDTPAASGQITLQRGLTRPSKKAQLAMRVSGVIATRPVAEGDRVQAGQLIAELNSELEKASLAISTTKAESDHEVVAAAMSEKQSLVELGRVQDLFDHKNATKWELEKASVESEIAKLRTQYARFQRQVASLENARDAVALKERRLLAPFAGVISKTLKEAGEAVQESQPIVELVKYDPLLVEFNVPEKLLDSIKKDELAEVTIEGRTAQAKVIMVDPQVDSASGTGRVRLELANPDAKFKSGQVANAKFRPGKLAPAAPVVDDTPKK